MKPSPGHQSQIARVGRFTELAGQCRNLVQCRPFAPRKAPVLKCLRQHVANLLWFHRRSFQIKSGEAGIPCFVNQPGNQVTTLSVVVGVCVAKQVRFSTFAEVCVAGACPIWLALKQVTIFRGREECYLNYRNRIPTSQNPSRIFVSCPRSSLKGKPNSQASFGAATQTFFFSTPLYVPMIVFGDNFAGC